MGCRLWVHAATGLLLVACTEGQGGNGNSFGSAGVGDSTAQSETGAGASEAGEGEEGGSGGGDGLGESSSEGATDAPCAGSTDCDDGIACTVDSCDPIGGCQHVADDGMCATGNACSGAQTCDADVGCVAAPPVDCDDADTCTADTCDPASGTCNHQSIAACTSGDGCCPAGCGADVDDDCECGNFAPSATPTQSDGGGSGGYGPAAWIDGVEEHDCVPGCGECYGWVDNPEGSQGLTEWMQLAWDEEQTIGSMYIATSDDLATPCATPGFPRNIERGQVQYWDGADWVDALGFSNESDDLRLDFNPPLQTVAVRVDGVRATPSANPQIAPPGSSIVFEWYVYEPTGCYPDLPPV